MQTGFDGEFEFGADPVGARDQYRLPVAIQWQLEQGTEASQPGQYFGSPGAGNRRLDILYQPVAGIDIDAGVPVAQGLGRVRGGRACLLRAQGGTPNGSSGNGSGRLLLV